MNRELLTAREVSEVMGLSTARVYEIIRRGILPAVRIGRQVRVHRADLAAVLRGTSPEAHRRTAHSGYAGEQTLTEARV